jgi:hypothetical protein
MGKYKLVVLSNATKGREEEYNDWYSNQHLDDVVAIPGFASALRLKHLTPVAGDYEHKYIAIYDIDADDPQAAVQALTDTASAGMFISESLDLDNLKCAVFEVCSSEVTAPKEKTPA